MGVTWNLIKKQPTSNIVGRLGKRAGMDIQENINDVVRFRMFDDAGLWANIGQGDPKTDTMPRNLEELTSREQTVNYQRIDLQKMDLEVYLAERAYHNASETYIFLMFVMSPKSKDTAHSYIRPHGKYYDYLVEKGYSKQLEKMDTPNYAPKVPIENETEEKQVG